MAPYQHKENAGSLFVNNRKEQAGHADWRGSAKIGDVEFWIDAWGKEGQKGPWLSLSFKPKNEAS